jgi:hypothetical protein
MLSVELVLSVMIRDFGSLHLTYFWMQVSFYRMGHDSLIRSLHKIFFQRLGSEHALVY